MILPPEILPLVRTSTSPLAPTDRISGRWLDPEKIDIRSWKANHLAKEVGTMGVDPDVNSG